MRPHSLHLAIAGIDFNFQLPLFRLPLRDGVTLRFGTAISSMSPTKPSASSGSSILLFHSAQAGDCIVEGHPICCDTGRELHTLEFDPMDDLRKRQNPNKRSASGRSTRDILSPRILKP
jgi:hypothetical protein